MIPALASLFLPFKTTENRARVNDARVLELVQTQELRHYYFISVQVALTAYTIKSSFRANDEYFFVYSTQHTDRPY